MPAENEKIFVRKMKSGYIATYNGVKGKHKTMFGAIERAQKNYLELNNILNDSIDAILYSLASNLEGVKQIDTTRSFN